MKLLFSLLSLIAAFGAGVFLLYPWREMLHRYQVARLKGIRDTAAKTFKNNNATINTRLIKIHNLERKNAGLLPIIIDQTFDLKSDKIFFDSYNEIINAINQHYNNHVGRDVKIGTLALLVAMLIFGVVALLIV